MTRIVFLISSLTTLILVSISCNGSLDKNIAIIPLKGWDREVANYNQGKMFINRSDYYLVEGFRDNEATKKYIEDFLFKNKNFIPKKYNSYVVSFYKESNETNLKTIALRPNVIDPFSRENDLTYAYEWDNGKFLMYMHFKNGEMIEPKKDNHIKVEDVPKSVLDSRPLLR